jgi:hypothetical protein
MTLPFINEYAARLLMNRNYDLVDSDIKCTYMLLSEVRISNLRGHWLSSVAMLPQFFVCILGKILPVYALKIAVIFKHRMRNTGFILL